MKVPVSWLREYVEFSTPLEELAAMLAVSTCEVERIVRRGVPDEDGNLGRYRVGRVVEAGKHPNADRLQLCRVDVGEGEPRQIVCGAWNFGAGATVAVALPGAVLPGGTVLGEAKLRGELSSGMILSERELELGTDHTGIMVLEEAFEPGTPLADVLPLVEDVLEVEVTGNRPDLLSIYGLAREVAALTGGELGPPPGVDPPRAGDEPVSVTIEEPDACPVYIGRLFRDVRVGPSPAWIRARLAAAGMRPISNVVDATNYAMLALGSPLHAFDHAKLHEGRIVVRYARPGEQIRTLDGQERELTTEELLIADADRAIAIGAIMGGEDSEVTDETSSVLLEAANFEPVGILRSSARLRLRTEGSNRWEKGVDPHLADHAARLCTQLLVEHAGAGWTGESAVRAPLPEPERIELRFDRASALIGLDVPEERQRQILQGLGFTDEFVVPTWRARDVTREIDLVEEVARFELDRVPFTLPRRREMFGTLTPLQKLRRTVEDVLVGAGFTEAYTPSLAPDDPNPRALELPDPISADQRVLRTELTHGLVDAARHNVHVGNDRIALFEIARVYLPVDSGLPDERWHVGGIVEGASHEEAYLRAKGAVELLYGAVGAEPRFDRVHDLADADLEGAWAYFELDLHELLEAAPPTRVYEDVITYPALKQDLAFVVDEDVPAGELVAAAQEAAGPELREARVFDVFRGEQTGAGKKSVAFSVEFQSSERTLSDEDAARLRERIVETLAERFGAVLRA